MLGHKEMLIKASSNAEFLHTWHRRFDYRNLQTIKCAVKKNKVEGTKFKKYNCVSKCEVCLRANITRHVFLNKSETKSSRILNLVHCDYLVLCKM